MRIVFLITLSFIINIYAQFTSGTDYSGKTEEIKLSKEAGTVLYIIKSDIKWEFANPNGINFNANSNMTGLGYGLFFNMPTDSYRFFFKGDHIYRDISNSASKHEYVTEGEDPVYTNIEVENFSLNQIRAETGFEFMKKYRLAVKADYASEEDENSLQFGGLAEYKADLENRKFITVGIEFNSEGKEGFLAMRKSYAEIRPYQLYAIGLTKGHDASEISSFVKYSKYYSSVMSRRETDYLNFEFRYNRAFKTASADMSLSAGSNLTTNLKSPLVNLPYFYYKMSFGTEFSNKKIGLNIGWNYGMYKIVLTDRMQIPDVATDVSESSGYYTLDIKLSYRF